MFSFNYKLTQFEGAIRTADGYKVLLLTIREGTARRLGVKCQPMVSPTAYGMQLSQEYNVDDSYETDMNAPDNTLADDLSLAAKRSTVKDLLLSLHERNYYGDSPRWIACRLYEISKLLFGEITDVAILQLLPQLHMDAYLDCTWLIEFLTKKVCRCIIPNKFILVLKEL